MSARAPSIIALAGVFALSIAAVPDVPQDADAPSSRPASRPAVPGPASLPGYRLFVQQCAPCHGDRGDGRGPGAAFLDPPPRDFTRGLMRFVGASNGAPSGKDIYETIAAGVGGTAMLPFASLGENEVWALVDVVLAFRREGARDRLGAAMSGAELDRAVVAATTPADDASEAGEGPPTAESAARGLLHYRTLCAQCHGQDGRGLAMEPRKTDEGTPIRPRDFTRGVMKQIPIPKNLFDRIRYGMPGTPMAAVPRSQLDAAGVWDLIHYLRTLMPESAQQMADPGPRDIPALRFEGAPPVRIDDPRFAAAPSTWIPLAPFRAEEATVPGVFVQALYGAGFIAFRCRVPDLTENVPKPGDDTPPDGLAIRLNAMHHAPVLPPPGQPPRQDRGLCLTGPMPDPKDPVFTALPRFENPDAVCRGIFPAERLGTSEWKFGAWTHVLAVRSEQAGDPLGSKPIYVSFAAFDGALRRGPLPAAFSSWHEIVRR